MKQMKRFAKGQSIVELALILPFLIMITIGTMELGYYVYTYSELENATRIASERASKTPPFTMNSGDDSSSDKCGVLIKEAATDGVTISNLTYDDITISFPENARARGKQVEVRIEYQGEWLSPVGERIFGQFLTFNFASRRPIVSLLTPDVAPNCT
ncbi:MAG: pilus assembly protein [Chloroflexi bacterium]|nr:pilus assembly protein [Chloroflexota bacterium]